MNAKRQITRVAWLMGGKLTILLLLFFLVLVGMDSGWFGVEDSRVLFWLKIVLGGLFFLSIPFTFFAAGYLTRLLRQHDRNTEDVEQKLGDYSARLNSFIEHPGYVSIYSIDTDYRYTGFNSLHKQEMKEVFDADVQVGVNILEVLPKDWAERAVKNYDKALQGEHFQVTSLLKDKYFSQVFNPVRDPNNQVIGLTSSIFDVTERVRAEQELESYKDQLEELVKDRTSQLERQTLFFQEIIDSLPNLIFVRDKKSRYVLVNKAMADTFGKSTGEVVGKSVLETHYDKKEAIRFEEEDREVIKYDEVIEQESFHKNKDGSGRWLFLSKRKMKVFDDEYVLGFHFDINHLKETELKLLEANQELKNALNRLKSAQMRLVESEKMASLGQLTAGLAHEINNPINYVAGNVSPIRRDIEELRNYLKELKKEQNEENEHAANINVIFDELESLLDGVDEGTARVKNLMSDLNAFSLPDASKKQPCDLNDSLRTTINLIRHHLKNRIELKVDLGEIPEINCNSQQLSQVFLNMLNNAVQAIDGNGTIKITSRLKKDHVVIAFKDTGSGISKKHLSKIFDPFFTTKDVGEGTGLGLAISYRIVEEHKGHIKVTSKEGEGTKFSISLPIS
ncbi:PAS domain-containing sensor histidine kinase [Marinoscillum sp.]|uniref:PAS domain-containing sensor histidine kinase n=1 Tax=Marinoscillum sp. TaxID=2024838 RepID=UPI003BAB5809